MTYFGLRQIDVAKNTGLTKSTINNYCIRRREPKQDAIVKTCTAYGLHPFWFMGYDCPMFLDPKSIAVSNDDAEMLMIYSHYDNEQKEKLKKVLRELF